MDLIDDLRALATELALSAGTILRNGSAAADHGITTKSTATDVVTATDKASERHIMEMIAARRPDDGLLGEEGTSEKGTSGIEWVVDPLDGTVNFLYGIPSFAVSIGVMVDGSPAVGAVYNPLLDELYTAATGKGATCNGASIRVSQPPSLDVALVATGFSYSAAGRAAQAAVLQRVLPNVRDIRRMGAAALDLCNVACGRVDAYYEVGIQPWDVTAGLVIAREAGAVVTGFESELPDGAIVAASPTVHSAMIELLH